MTFHRRALPPVYSPLSPGALFRGVTSGFRGDRDLRAVERLIQESYGARAVALTDSGTSALRLALEAMGGSGGRVAMPAYNCYDLISAARGADIELVFYDVDPNTLGPDPASLSRALEMGASCVVVAYLSGVPVDLDAVRAMTGRHGALLIEDAAQGIGGSHGGRPLGSLGDLSVLSFARGKGRTGGGGGALIACTHAGADVFERVPPLPPAGRQAGVLARTAAQWALTRPFLYGIPLALPGLGLGETHYRDPELPRGMSTTSAGIVASTWTAAAREGRSRRDTASKYREALGGRPDVRLPRIPPGSEAGYLRFPIVTERPVVADRVHASRLGIAPAYPRILPDVQPRPGDDSADELRGARLLSRCSCTLPTHRYVADTDVEEIVAAVAGAA